MICVRRPCRAGDRAGPHADTSLLRPQGLTTAKTVAKVSVVSDAAEKKSVTRRSTGPD